MVQREPRHADAFASRFERVANETYVVDQVAMREHHALGLARRSRRVLQQGQIVGLAFVFPIVDRLLVSQLVDRKPQGVAQTRGLVEIASHTLQTRGRTQHDLRRGVLGNGVNPLNRPVAAQRISGDGDDSRVEAAEKRFDEVESRREQQHRALAAHRSGLQSCGYGASPSIEFRVAPARFLLFAVGKAKSRRIGSLLGPVSQRVDNAACRRPVRCKQVIQFHRRPSPSVWEIMYQQ